MKRFVMALALVCALSTSIFAGNMPTGGFVDPPPPPTASQLSETQPSEIASTETPLSEVDSNVVVTVVLTIISLI